LSGVSSAARSAVAIWCESLAILAAGGTAAGAQEELNFKAASIDHVSIQVADLQRSIDFYQKIFASPW